MKWKLPQKTKIYEALGAVADNRVEIDGSLGKVYSSSRNKFYNISYDAENQAIMSNDNSSYWKGDLGYPSIAFLMKSNVLSYDEKIGQLLKGVAWKDINQKFKNDFDKALESILAVKNQEERQTLAECVDRVYAEIKILDLSYLGKKTLPPSGY